MYEKLTTPEGQDWYSEQSFMIHLRNVTSARSSSIMRATENHHYSVCKKHSETCGDLTQTGYFDKFKRNKR